jgi:hypothetical protein
VPDPTVTQLRTAADAVRIAGQDATNLVAAVCARVLTRHDTSGSWLLERALFLVYWSVRGATIPAGGPPAWWPLDAVWWFVATHKLAGAQQRGECPEFVAWRIGTVLTRITTAASTDDARRIAVARNLFLAWRDELTRTGLRPQATRRGQLEATPPPVEAPH